MTFTLKTILLFSWQLLEVLCAQHFVSHVRVTTAAHSYSHGVVNPLQRHHVPPIKNLRMPQVTQAQIGYPRQRPSFPFHAEDAPGTILPWQQQLRKAEKIRLLPQSPYKVDSADPESLWPEGLFLPPLAPARLDVNRRSTQNGHNDPTFLDPYLLQGSEALSAVEKSKYNGELYFHDVPHIKSLLSNQQHRVKNNLKPHRLGSIRHSWPFNRI